MGAPKLRKRAAAGSERGQHRPSLAAASLPAADYSQPPPKVCLDPSWFEDDPLGSVSCGDHEIGAFCALKDAR